MENTRMTVSYDEFCRWLVGKAMELIAKDETGVSTKFILQSLVSCERCRVCGYYPFQDETLYVYFNSVGIGFTEDEIIIDTYADEAFLIRRQYINNNLYLTLIKQK